MSKGYLIPENAQPTLNRCLRVFVPDDPLYIAAFLGALTYFGQWTAWERDKEKRGQFAAHAWRDANELTIDGLSTPCGDYPLTDDEMSDILDKLDEISERLKELEDMDVIVNQTVNGCGCGCDGDTPDTTTTTVTIPGIDPTDTGISPPYDDTVYAVVDSVKCRTANWLVDSTIYVIRGWANIGAAEMVVVSLASALIGLFAIFNGVPADGIAWGMVIYFIAVTIIEISQLDDFQLDDLDVLAAEIESMREEFVCAMYGWTTANELSSALLGFLNSRVDETATAVGWSPETIDKIKNVFSKIFGSELSNYVVQNVDRIVPSDFVEQHDCICGATGDYCPDHNLVLEGFGSLPDGDLTETTQGFASQFNSTNGYHQVIFEVAANYCVSIDYGEYSPAEMHEVCSDGNMVSADGYCIRRFVARSSAPFGATVTFNLISADCTCVQPLWEAVSGEYCEAEIVLTELVGRVDWDGTVSKSTETGGYSFHLNRLDLSNYQGKTFKFYGNSEQGVTVTLIIKRENLADVELVLDEEAFAYFDFYGVELLSLTVHSYYGNYNLHCPQPANGFFSFVEV